MRNHCFAAMLACATLTCGCTTTAPLGTAQNGTPTSQPTAPPPAGVAVPADVHQAAQANNRFGLELYQRLRSREGNIAISPVSATSALAMTWAGARGETQREMGEVLGLAALGARAHSAVRHLSDNLQREDGAVAVYLANRLFPYTELGLLPSFEALMKSSYGSELQPLDYVSAPEASRKAINAWVDQETRHEIDNLLDPGTIVANTRLVLTNAIYFKGAWASAFDPKGTTDAPFYGARGTTSVKLMGQEGEFAQLFRDDVQLVELPYAGQSLSMIALLPTDPSGFDALEANLTSAKLDAWLAELQPGHLIVELPRFDVEYKLDLRSTLAAMGMPVAMGENPDFSGITGNRALSIAHVIHGANIQVNEQGTVAAGATAVVMKESAPPAFRADRPFLYLIRDRATGTIIFIGRVTQLGSST